MYDEILLEHNLYPKNRGKLEGCEIFRELKNASCGDKIFVQLKIRNGMIVDGKFEGVGCAIALASADLMIDAVRGKTIAQAKELSELFRVMIVDEEKFNKQGGEDKMGEAIALKIVGRMPARAKCAELAWRVFSDK
jgi:SUF system feS assembly protein, nifU family